VEKSKGSQQISQAGFCKKCNLFQSSAQNSPPEIILLQIRQVLGKMVSSIFSTIFFIIFVALFNREILRQNRDRYCDKFSEADFIHQEIGQIIIQTIMDCKRNFDNALEIGAGSGFVGREILDLKKTHNLLQVDFSPKVVDKHNLDLVMDDENFCLQDQSFDLVISNLNLHFINDIQKNLIDIKNVLRPKGMFIASFFGEENLKELKEVFFKTEENIYEQMSPRISPNIDIKSSGMLLQKAGFSDVVCEKHSLEVSYSSLKKMFNDLKNMGQSNILNGRSRKFMTKKFLFDLTENYRNLYSAPTVKPQKADEIVATFEIILLSGWK
jgi:SAM-dependent methyltransferase